ncbi:MAG TPA: ABC transporter permease, partial [Puia sp.]|nr:ABC transporter permease [Puia sp.]
MLIHYLRSAWRTIRRNPFYSLINIGCLAIGIAVCMTVLLYILHEHSFDRWQKNARRIYGVTVNIHFGDGSFNTPGISYATGPLVRQADGNVEAWLRMMPVTEPVAVKDAVAPEKDFGQERKLVYADSNFFDFFSFHLLRGNPASVLRRPFTVVLTETAAKRYFGDKDPIGRTLRIYDRYNFEVTGIAADLPSNTDIDFDAVVSMASMRSMDNYRNWMSSQHQRVQGGAFHTWLLLRGQDVAGQVEATMDRLAIVPGEPSNTRDAYTLTSLADYHLHSKVVDTSNLRYLTIFQLAAGLILLLALVNYMSLATARATARAKEVGVRKVMGAGRGRIAGQFYTESAVFAVSAFLAGTLIFLSIRPVFFGWLQLPIDTALLWSPGMLAFSGAL